MEELEKLHEILLDINERAIDDEKFNNLLSQIFDENIEDLISRIKKVLEEN